MLWRFNLKTEKEAFAEYRDEAKLDSRQIYFVKQIVEIFTDLNLRIGIRKVIDQVNANAVA